MVDTGEINLYPWSYYGSRQGTHVCHLILPSLHKPDIPCQIRILSLYQGCDQEALTSLFILLLQLPSNTVPVSHLSLENLEIGFEARHEK